MAETTSMLGLSGPGMGLTRMAAFAPARDTEPVLPHGVHFGGGGGLPEFYLPYPAKVSPHLDRARAHAAEWTRRIGIAKAGVWTDAWTDAQDYGFWAAVSVPEAAAAAVELTAAAAVWGFHYDDFFDDRFKRTRNIFAGQSYVDRLMTFMPQDLSLMPAPADPVQAGLADLWRRITPNLPPALRASFPAQLGEYLRAPLWETQNVILGRIPDPVDYVEMRRQTSAGEFTYALALACSGADLPAAAVEHRTMKAIREIFTEVPGLRNDIVSYDKELHREGEVHNAVRVVQHFLGTDRERATHIVNDLITARVKQFQRLTAVDVPAMAEELDLDATDRAAVSRVVAALRDWLAGDCHWAPRSARYH